MTLLRRGITPGGAGERSSPTPCAGPSYPPKAAITTSSDVHKQVPARGSTRRLRSSGTCPWPNCPMRPNWAIGPRRRRPTLDGPRSQVPPLGHPLALHDEERRRRFRPGRHDLRAQSLRHARRVRRAATWRTWRTGVRARIQPVETTVADVAGTARPPQYRIFVEENLELDQRAAFAGPMEPSIPSPAPSAPSGSASCR